MQDPSPAPYKHKQNTGQPERNILLKLLTESHLLLSTVYLLCIVETRDCLPQEIPQFRNDCNI